MNINTLKTFLLGSTALATSMCFAPLANAAPHNIDSLGFAEAEQARSVPVSAIDSNLLSGLSNQDTVDALSISMHSGGYEDIFEDSSEDDDAPRYTLRKDSEHLRRDDLDKKVGIYTTSDAVEAARYAQAVYSFTNPEDDKDIQAFLAAGSKISTLKPLKDEVSWSETTRKNQDTGIFVEKADGTAFISFKGSDRLNTWISDFDAMMIDHADGGRYHRGFLTMYNELAGAAWNSIMKFAEKNSYSVKEAMNKITVTGHSRGAGTAQVFADIAQRKTGVAPKLITFAAPRALHKKTAGEFNAIAKDKHLNILQGKDIVGYAALSAVNGGAHIGHKVYLPVDKDSWMHMMGGYRKALNTMHVLGKVKRARNENTGNTYRFESANANDTRELITEADNSLQAWGQTALNTYNNPVDAAQNLYERAEWAVSAPDEAAEKAIDTVTQVAANAGELTMNALAIGKLATVGTVKAAKKAYNFIISESSDDRSIFHKVQSAGSMMANGVGSVTKFVYGHIKDVVVGTDEVVESDESVAKRQALVNARQESLAKQYKELTGHAQELKKLTVTAKVKPAKANILNRAYNAIKFW